jgi:hypothetical protein
MNKDTRTLIQLTTTDLDEEHLKKYMGSKSEYRKELVDAGFNNLHMLKNVDL